MVLHRNNPLTYAKDAYILAHLLGHPLTTRATLHRALQAYEHVRLPMAHHVMEGSRRSGIMYELQSEFRDKYDVLGPAIERQWDWVGGPNPDEEVQRAVRWCYPEMEATAKL